MIQKLGFGITISLEKNVVLIVDTWWQTEIGGIMIAPFLGGHAFKTWICEIAFFGVRKEGEASGNLLITQPWRYRGQMQTIYGDPER